MESGRICPISQIQIGDRVSGGGIVYGVVSHSVLGIQLYRYNDWIVSGTQAVEHQGTWCRIHETSRRHSCQRI